MRITSVNNSAPAASANEVGSASQNPLLLEGNCPLPDITSEADLINWVTEVFKKANEHLKSLGAAELPEAFLEQLIGQIKAEFETKTALNATDLNILVMSLLAKADQSLLAAFPSTYTDKSATFHQFIFNLIELETVSIPDKTKETLEKEVNRFKDMIQYKIKLLQDLINTGLLSGESEAQVKETLQSLKDNLAALDRSDNDFYDEFFNKSNIEALTTLLHKATQAYETLKPTIPYDPNFPLDPNQDTFDTSIPRNADGSIDINALIRKLHDLMYYMYYGDCSNFNIYTATAGFLTNIAGVWNELSDEHKALFNKTMGSVPNNSSGKSLGEILAESVIYGKFYQFKGNDILLSKFIDDLKSKLEGIDSPFIKNFLDGIKKVERNLPAWEQTHITPEGQWLVSFDEFLKGQALVNASSGKSEEMYNLFDAIMRAKIQELEAIAKGDPFMLFYLLLMLLFEQNDNYQVEIAGVGKTLEKLGDLGDQAADIGLLFQRICQKFEMDNVSYEDNLEIFDMIKEFMSKTKSFCEEFKSDPRLTSSFSEISDAFDHLFSTDPEKGLLAVTNDDLIAFKKPDGSTGTFADYFNSITNNSTMDTKVRFVYNFRDMFSPGKIDPTNINPVTEQPYAPDLGTHYYQLTADIQAFGKAPLNMNSTLTVKMEDIKSTAEQFGAMITKFAKEPNDLVHRMLERIQR